MADEVKPSVGNGVPERITASNTMKTSAQTACKMVWTAYKRIVFKKPVQSDPWVIVTYE
jgi:hypothetical protein